MLSSVSNCSFNLTVFKSDFNSFLLKYPIIINCYGIHSIIFYLVNKFSTLTSLQPPERFEVATVEYLYPEVFVQELDLD